MLSRATGTVAGRVNYDPTTAQFLTRDPLVSSTREAYSYVGGSPLNATDPSGEFAILAVVAVAWAAFEVASFALDVYSTAITVLDPCVSTEMKAASVGLLAVSAFAVGGGYSYMLKKQAQKAMRNAPVTSTETASGVLVKSSKATDEWESFLGEGPYTNLNPRTGQADANRIVSADGKRSIRFGDHEMNSPSNKFHLGLTRFDGHVGCVDYASAARRVSYSAGLR